MIKEQMRLIQMIEDNYNCEEIAVEIGRPYREVSARVSELGLKVKGGNSRRSWREHERAELWRLRTGGAEWAEIATELKRSIHAVKRQFQELKKKDYGSTGS